MNLRKTIAAVLILLVLSAVCSAAGAETKVVGIVDPNYDEVILSYRLDDETKTAAVAGLVQGISSGYKIPQTVTYEGVQYTVTEIADRALKEAADRDLRIRQHDQNVLPVRDGFQRFRTDVRVYKDQLSLSCQIGQDAEFQCFTFLRYAVIPRLVFLWRPANKVMPVD